jgi:tRNA/rRNA methyltransferase
MKPSILLIRPQMGENIGAAARAMANFGLSDLRLVAPRDGWPNPKASDMAGRALNIVDDAALFDDTSSAVADCQYVLATTSRERAMNLSVLDMRTAMQELRARSARGEKCAVLFGPERTGLENEDVISANAVVTIPVAPEYPSLNIAQAVVVTCYEWYQSAGVGIQSSEADAVATREQLDGLFGQMEAALDDVNFWRIPAKKEIMWRNIRALMLRATPTTQEVATWRGLIRALVERD